MTRIENIIRQIKHLAWLFGILCAVLWPATFAYGWSMEAQQFTITSTFSNGGPTNVTFRQSYSSPPVVIVLPTTQGGDPSDVRIYDVTTTGFTVVQVEPNANDGPHVAMAVSYVAVEEGVHTMPDGTLIEAGFLPTNSVQHGAGVIGATSWDMINFSAPFTSAPAWVGALQSINNESASPPQSSSIPFLSVTANNVSATSIDVAIERSESGAGSVTSAETIGYIAIENNSAGVFEDNAGVNRQYEAFISTTGIRGWSNGCFTQSFTHSYSANPLVVATKITRIESDGGWLRRCSLSSSSVGLRIDEDRDNDNERSHVEERGALLVFDRNFDARFEPQLEFAKDLLTVNDPYSATNHKAIAGSTIAYNLTVRNEGIGTVDTDSLILVDPIPVYGDLVVDDISGPGSGPVIFVDGSPSSNLTYTYTSLASSSDDVSFSNDNGATFNYTPSADANGVDVDVTHIRVNPKGVFAGRVGASPPSLSVEFRIRVE